MTKIDGLIGQKRLLDLCFRGVYDLGQNKMEHKPPFPQIKDEAAQKPEHAIFPSLIWWGGRANFPSILSQIEVCCHEASLTAQTKKAYSK